MNKKELVNAVSEKTGLSKNDTKKTLDVILETIGIEMQKNEKIILVGFGTFSVSEKAARRSVNPRTLEPMTIPAKKVVRFKPSIYLDYLLVLKKKRGRPKAAEQ